MKKLITILLLFVCGISYAQNTVSLPAGTSSVVPQFRYFNVPDSLKQLWAVWPSPNGVNRMITFTEFNAYTGTKVRDSLTAKAGKNLLNVSKATVTGKVDTTVFRTVLNSYTKAQVQALISGGGTVSSVSVVSANGLAGSVATATTTPAITLSTTITGVLKGNGTAISAATVADLGKYWQKPSPTVISPLTSGDNVDLGSGMITANGADFRAIGANNPIGIILGSDYTVVGNPKSLITSWGQSTVLGGIEFRQVDGSGAGTQVPLYINPSGAYVVNGDAGTTGQVLKSNGASALPSWTTVSSVTPAALTRTNDTNVTLTLGGTPSTALLQATSITVGWTGTLADSRIASASTWNAKENALTFSTGLTRSTNTITVNQAFSPTWTGQHTFNTPIISNGGDFRDLGVNNPVGLILSTDYTVIGNPKTVYTNWGSSTVLGGIELRQVNGSGTGTQVPLYINPSGAYVISGSAGSSGDVLQSNGSGAMPSWVAPSASGVSSVTGTAGQVIVSGPTGAVNFSLPQSIATTSTVAFASVVATSPNSSAGVAAISASGNALSGVSGNASALNIVNNSSSLATIASSNTGSGPLIELSNSSAIKFSVSNSGALVNAGSISAGTSIISGVNGSSAGLFMWESSATGSSRRWRSVSNLNVNGDWVLQQSTTQTGGSFADAMSFDASRIATMAAYGTGTATFTAGTLSAVSDSLAKNVKGKFIGSALVAISKISQPKYWNYNAASGLPVKAQQVNQFGLLADRVANVLGNEFAPIQGSYDSAGKFVPQLIDGKPVHGLSLTAIVGLLTQGLQEASAQIQELKKEVDTLKSQK